MSTLNHILWAVGFTEAHIKRGPFWVAIAISFLVHLVVMLMLNDSSPKSGPANVVALVLLAGNLYAWLVIAAGRCRDAGFPGWLAFLTLIPLLGQIGVLMLGIVGSKPDIGAVSEK